MHRLGWPWPDSEVVWWAARARKALRKHAPGVEDPDRLAREYLLRVARFGPVRLDGWRCPCRTGEPVRSLKEWKHHPPEVAEHILTAEDTAFAAAEEIHRWVTQWVGWPVGRRGDLVLMRVRKTTWGGMRGK